ncbi:hypothetical protein D3C80_315520 [compost metagenome]
MPGRNLPHGGNAGPGAVIVDRREIEFLAPSLAISGRAGAVFTRKQTSGERRPYHEAELFLLHQRHDLTLQITAGNRVIGLHRFETGKTSPFRNAERLGNPPRRPVGKPDIANEPA